MESATRSEYGLAVIAIGAALLVLFAAAGAIGASGNTIPRELWAAGGALSGALVGVLVPAPKVTRTSTAAATGTSIIDGAAIAAAEQTAGQIEADANASNDTKTAARDAVAAVAANASAPAVGSSPTEAIHAALAAHQSAAGEDQEDGSGQVKQAAAVAAARAQNSAQDRTAQAGTAAFLGQALKVLLPASIFVIALYFGIRMSDGSIRFAAAANCPVTSPIAANTTEAPCAATLFQTANALIALASAAGGALIGLYANPPGGTGKTP